MVVALLLAGMVGLWSAAVPVMTHLIRPDPVGNLEAGPLEAPSSSPESPVEPRSGADRGRYVAIGDSYTAGPGVEPPDPESGECLRSAAGYPALIAATLAVGPARNVSCVGAETSDVHFPQVIRGVPLPPQLAAVRRSTRLVTVGLGANDEAIFTRLMTRCAGAARLGNPCQEVFLSEGQNLEAAAARTSDRLVEVVRAIEERAPRARIVVVGYLRLLPDDAGCSELPFASSDLPYMAGVLRSLRDAQARAAELTGVTFLDVWRLSAGHDACSPSPWVEGARSVHGAEASMHPNAEGMRQVAEAFTTRFSIELGRSGR